MSSITSWCTSCSAFFVCLFFFLDLLEGLTYCTKQKFTELWYPYPFQILGHARQQTNRNEICDLHDHQYAGGPLLPSESHVPNEFSVLRLSTRHVSRNASAHTWSEVPGTALALTHFFDGFHTHRFATYTCHSHVLPRENFRRLSSLLESRNKCRSASERFFFHQYSLPRAPAFSLGSMFFVSHSFNFPWGSRLRLRNGSR